MCGFSGDEALPGTTMPVTVLGLVHPLASRCQSSCVQAHCHLPERRPHFLRPLRTCTSACLLPPQCARDRRARCRPRLRQPASQVRLAAKVLSGPLLFLLSSKCAVKMSERGRNGQGDVFVLHRDGEADSILPFADVHKRPLKPCSEAGHAPGLLAPGLKEISDSFSVA